MILRDDRAEKQRLVRHAFERAAALASGDVRVPNALNKAYVQHWSHRMEELAELGVQDLIRGGTRQS